LIFVVNEANYKCLRLAKSLSFSLFSCLVIDLIGRLILGI
jgi:hypothetical protein